MAANFVWYLFKLQAAKCWKNWLLRGLRYLFIVYLVFVSLGNLVWNINGYFIPAVSVCFCKAYLAWSYFAMKAGWKAVGSALSKTGKKLAYCRKICFLIFRVKKSAHLFFMSVVKLLTFWDFPDGFVLSIWLRLFACLRFSVPLNS